MRMIIGALILVMPSIALGNDVRHLTLANSDSKEFQAIISGFSSPETQPDPSDSNSWFTVRSLASKSGAFVAACSTHVVQGEEGPTSCVVTFDLTVGSTDVTITKGRIEKSLVAKFNDQTTATQLFANMGHLPYAAAEKVLVTLPNGSQGKLPRLRMNCDLLPDSASEAKTCTMLAFPTTTVLDAND